MEIPRRSGGERKIDPVGGIVNKFHHPDPLVGSQDLVGRGVVDASVEDVDRRGKIAGNLRWRAGQCSVRDTGDGFGEKALSHLFLPFFTTKEKGSGLGLAIVKRIIDQLEGRISGTNRPEGGAEGGEAAEATVSHPGIQIYRFSGGKVVELDDIWVVPDDEGGQ